VDLASQCLHVLDPTVVRPAEPVPGRRVRGLTEADRDVLERFHIGYQLTWSAWGVMQTGAEEVGQAPGDGSRFQAHDQHDADPTSVPARLQLSDSADDLSSSDVLGTVDGPDRGDEAFTRLFGLLHAARSGRLVLALSAAVAGGSAVWL